MSLTSKIANEIDQSNKDYRKNVFDKKAKALPLDIGQLVMLRVPMEGKLDKSEWRGPYPSLTSLSP